MAGITGGDWRCQSLRSLLIGYQGNLLNQWDQTVLVASEVQHLHAFIHNGFARQKMEFLSGVDMHPYREREQADGLVIDQSNFEMLKQIF